MPQVFSSLPWLQGMSERVGCSPEEETGADCILLETPPVLEGQEEGLQLGSPAGRWALESLWMKVHGWHGQNVWQVCNRLRVAQGSLAISLSSVQRDVSRLEGGDGDTGNIGWFKANWWHHFGALQRSLSGQVPLPSSRNFLGSRAVPEPQNDQNPLQRGACSEPALSSELLQEMCVWHHWLFVQKTIKEAKICMLHSLEILGKSFPLERVVLMTVERQSCLCGWLGHNFPEQGAAPGHAAQTAL